MEDYDIYATPILVILLLEAPSFTAENSTATLSLLLPTHTGTDEHGKGDSADSVRQRRQQREFSL